MKHDMVDMELLSKDVIDMIQSLDIPEVSRVVRSQTCSVLRKEKV